YRFDDLNSFSFYDISEYEKNVSKIRFIIKEIYPGAQFDDTAITKIVFFEITSKKPSNLLYK
ncbi:MAG: hypothetical protein JW982_12395, partial [Spirochaetes bacterium]|nr:hypothetical protein [Spirochaetota bacterium]